MLKAPSRAATTTATSCLNWRGPTTVTMGGTFFAQPKSPILPPRLWIGLMKQDESIAILAYSQLASWGLDVSLHEAWLTRDGSVRLFNGQLVRWGASIPDRLVFALSDLGRPATIDEMIRHVGETRARVSVGQCVGIGSPTE